MKSDHKPLPGDDWLPVYHEVPIRNRRQSEEDTPDQAQYRREIAAAIDQMRAEGGEPIPVNEIP